jgi:type II secretory pathway pseudopilin PulG
MLLWTVLVVVGFLGLMAVIVALGTSSTARYERERRARGRSARPPLRSLGVLRAT